MVTANSSTTRTQEILLLTIRLWLGYRLFTAGYSSVLDILFHPKNREFFEKWFGNELHIPFPLFSAFLAKGAEVLGGILVFFGFYTKIGALLIAFTMLIATLVANLGKDFEIDGGFTISYFLFALVLLVEGGGKYRIDEWIKKQAVRPA